MIAEEIDSIKEEHRKEKERHAKKRKRDVVKALRKKRVVNRAYGYEWYDSLHQYSKNKIHCSCPMCSEKTNLKHFRGDGFGRRGRKEWEMWKVPPICQRSDDGEVITNERQESPLL